MLNWDDLLGDVLLRVFLSYFPVPKRGVLVVDLACDLHPLVMRVVDLTFKEGKLLLELLVLSDFLGEYPFVLHALIAVEHVELDEFEPFLFELQVLFIHLLFYLSLIGFVLELDEILVGLG